MPPRFCAVLVLDSGGRITGLNTTARQLWAAGEADLIGVPFAGLFAFEVVSTDADFLELQWEALVGTVNRETRLVTHAPRGTSREVRVQLEAQSGPAGGYIASLRPSTPNASAVRGQSSGSAGPWDILTEGTAAGFFDLHLKTGHVQFSPSWKRLLGYNPAELPDTLETWHRLIHPEDSAAAPDKLARKLPATQAATNRPFSVEFRMQHQRGHWSWIHCIGVQIVSVGGELDRVVGIHLDVNERKEVEDTLVANDARLQSLTDDGPLGAFELDFSTQEFWFSPAFERLLGYGLGELPATLDAFAAALPIETGMDPGTWIQEQAPGESAFIQALHLRTREGASVPVLLGIHRTLTRRRELIRAVGFAIVMPAELHDPENGVSALLTTTALETLAEAVVMTDARGSVLLANAAAGRMLRLAPDSLPGHPVADVLRLINRQTQRPSENPVARALAADGPLPLVSDDLLAPLEGEPQPIVWTARAAIGAGGMATGVVIIFRNPEEMTLTPEELVKANRLESLGLLAGGIAHDFNNLLTTILGALSLAKDNRDYSALGDAEQASLAAKGLTKQLLAFAKGSSATQLVCAAKDLLADSTRIASAASNAEITVEVAEDTENVLVDRGQMLQVFQNLVVNALQAMPPEPHQPRVQIRAGNTVVGIGEVPGLDAGSYVEFEVRDNGSGIKPEHLEKIFAPFFTTKKHGTGLGLATVLSIVRKHGGQIALDSQVGVGTVFTVYLPQAGKAVEVQARKAASLRFGTGRVLFMDDDPRISDLTATMLQSLDYHCDLAKDGAEAVALYKRYLNIGRPYDVVIMDLTVVGGMGGEQCYHELKKLDPDVRAIIASGYDNDDMARDYLEQGFCAYLTKPYRVADLGKVLKTVLG